VSDLAVQLNLVAFLNTAEWSPPNLTFRCAYITAWVAKWELAMDSAEEAAIRDGFSDCPE